MQWRSVERCFQPGFQANHPTIQVIEAPERERRYLDELVRGVYARRPLPAGYAFDSATFASDCYLAIPLQRGQLSCREVINGERLTRALEADAQLTIDDVDGPYSRNPGLRRTILERGRD